MSMSINERIVLLERIHKKINEYGGTYVCCEFQYMMVVPINRKYMKKHYKWFYKWVMKIGKQYYIGYRWGKPWFPPHHRSQRLKHIREFIIELQNKEKQYE